MIPGDPSIVSAATRAAALACGGQDLDPMAPFPERPSRTSRDSVTSDASIPVQGPDPDRVPQGSPGRCRRCREMQDGDRRGSANPGTSNRWTMPSHHLAGGIWGAPRWWSGRLPYTFAPSPNPERGGCLTITTPSLPPSPCVAWGGQRPERLSERDALIAATALDDAMTVVGRGAADPERSGVPVPSSRNRGIRGPSKATGSLARSSRGPRRRKPRCGS